MVIIAIIGNTEVIADIGMLTKIYLGTATITISVPEDTITISKMVTEVNKMPQMYVIMCVPFAVF